MKPYQIAMALALCGAAALLLFGDRSPSGEVAEAAPRRAPNGASAPRAAATATAVATSSAAAASLAGGEIVQLRPRAELVGQDGEPGFASGEAVFGSQNWNPPPPPPPRASAEPAPVAPPLPFTYLGKAAADGAWEVFLSRGNQTYVVRAQAIIDGQYRVETIAPPLMTITYLPLKQIQQLNIGVLD